MASIRKNAPSNSEALSGPARAWSGWSTPTSAPVLRRTPMISGPNLAPRWTTPRPSSETPDSAIDAATVEIAPSGTASRVRSARTSGCERGGNGLRSHRLGEPRGHLAAPARDRGDPIPGVMRRDRERGAGPAGADDRQRRRANSLHVSVLLGGSKRSYEPGHLPSPAAVLEARSASPGRIQPSTAAVAGRPECTPTLRLLPQRGERSPAVPAGLRVAARCR